MAFLVDGSPPSTPVLEIEDLTVRSSGEIGKSGVYSWRRMCDGKGEPTKFCGNPGFVLVVDRNTANTNPITKPVRISFV